MLQTDIIQQNEKREYDTSNRDVEEVEVVRENSFQPKKYDDIIGESYYTINDEDFNHYISTILFSLLDVFDENV